jgi:hypothetical protein
VATHSNQKVIKGYGNKNNYFNLFLSNRLIQVNTSLVKIINKNGVISIRNVKITVQTETFGVWKEKHKKAENKNTIPEITMTVI